MQLFQETKGQKIREGENEMKVKINENNHKLVALINGYCNAHRAPWHWFFGWRNYREGVSTYRISKPAWDSIQATLESLEDIEAEKSADC